MMRKRIGRYELTGTLGEGGIGIVYAARDPQLGRALAISASHRDAVVTFLSAEGDRVLGLGQPA